LQKAILCRFLLRFDCQARSQIKSEQAIEEDCEQQNQKKDYQMGNSGRSLCGGLRAVLDFPAENSLVKMNVAVSLESDSQPCDFIV
jgi:hypothetical protein